MKVKVPVSPEQLRAVARDLRSIIDTFRIELPIKEPVKIVVNGNQGRAYLSIYPPAVKPKVKKAKPAVTEVEEELSFYDFMGCDYHTSHEINGDC